MDGITEWASDGQHLSQHLLRTFSGISRKRVLVGVASGGKSAARGIEDDKPLEPATALIRPGCLTKLVTARFCMKLVKEGVLALDDPAASYLQPTKVVARCLGEALTIRHLLEHTHGLDDSGLALSGFQDGIRVDPLRLCEQLSSNPRLAPPGAAYSYSRAGSWLIAAIIESRLDMPFARILESSPSPVSQALARSVAGGQLCAAEGGRASTPFAEMLAFASQQLLPGSPFDLGAAAENPTCITRLPGWAPQEKGIYLGWKYYGSGWFGHNSVLPGGQSLVRVHPGRSMALLIASRDQAVSAVSAALFAKVIPELHGLTPQSPDARVPDIGEGCGTTCIGTYANGALSAHVEKSHEGELSLRVESSQGSRGMSGWQGTLRAKGDLFFLQGSAGAPFPFVQFVGGTSGIPRSLWDGRQLYPRCGTETG